MPSTCLHPPDPTDPLAVQAHRLDNGLQVWLSVNPDEPRVFASVVARVGSGEDPADATGLAHYMEHMLANKGSERLGTLDRAAEAPLLAEISDLFDTLFDTEDPSERARLVARIDDLECTASRYAVPNELKQAYSRMGGRGFNATTSKERTNYFIDLPANMLERWMMLESDRFESPVFRAFFSEVQTVVEEKNRALDDAGRRSSAALDRLLWGGHPYGNETLGRNEHLARPRVSRMQQFFRDWVVPSNMALVLAGDLDPAAVVALAEQYFGGYEDRPTPPRASPHQLPRLHGEAVADLTHHGAPAIHIAWRTVPFDHPDRAALRMADMLLDNGKTGLIDTALNASKKVRSAGAFPRLYRDGGAQVLWARPLAGQSLDEAGTLLLEQIERLRDGDIDPDLLQSIFLHWELGELAARESNKARAGWMTAAFVHRLTWAEQRAELERHRAVTVDDVARVARTYFGPDRVVVRRHTGEPTEAPLPVPDVTARSIETTAHSVLFDEVLATPVAPLAPQHLERGRDWSVREAPAGTLYANRNPHSDLCQISWIWEVGYEGARGRSHALRLWSLSGEGSRSRIELDRWLHDQGVRVAARCRRHDTHLSLAGPSEAVEATLGTVFSRWKSPRIDPDVGRAYLEDSVRRRQVDKETKKTLVGAARGYALYGAASTMLAHSPSDEEVLGLLDAGVGGEPRFVELLRPLLRTARDVVYTGSTAVDALVGHLSPLGMVDQPEPVHAPMRKARTDRPRVILVHHAGTQASVTVYRCVGPHRLDRLVPGRLLAGWLGGSAGVCFQELREARAMAYSTSGGLSFGAHAGDDDLLWAQAATHPGKAAAAATLLVDILDRPLDDAGRFARVQADAIQALRTDRILARSVPASARWWARRGFPADPRRERLEQIRLLDQAAVEGFRQGLAADPPVVVVVGDTSAMDLGMLGAIGVVERVAPADLFAY